MISSQKELLDNLVEEYELALNERLDDLEALISDMIDKVNMNASSINDTLNEVSNSVGYTMSEEMSGMWQKAASAFNDNNQARIAETERILNKLVAEGVLDRAKADEIKAAVVSGDLQNATNIINKLESEGVLSKEQSEALKTAVNTTGTSYTGVVSTYGENFKDKLTTVNEALGSIKSYCNTMLQKAEEEAKKELEKIKQEEEDKKKKENEAKNEGKGNPTNTKDDAKNAAGNGNVPVTSGNVGNLGSTGGKKETNTNGNKGGNTGGGKTPTTDGKKKNTGGKQPAKNQPAKKQPTKQSTQGDGKIQVGDQVTFKSGRYYYSPDGMSPTGYQYLGRKVYVTKIDNASWAIKPYHISVGNRLGNGDLGWLTKSQLSGYASGLRKARKDEDAWVNEKGLEAILKPSEHAIVTHISKGDSVLDAEATKNLFALANDPSSYLGRSSVGMNYEKVPNSTDLNLHNEFSVTLPNVTNYEDFRRAMQKDPKMEKLLVSMIVDPMLGKGNTRKQRLNL